jgi:hypothetical protein
MWRYRSPVCQRARRPQRPAQERQAVVPVQRLLQARHNLALARAKQFVPEGAYVFITRRRKLEAAETAMAAFIV